MAKATQKVWSPTRGEIVWARDEAECFIKTLVYQVDENTVETEVEPNQRLISDVFPMNPESQDGVPDHTMMDFLYDANLLHNITVRYMRDDIYSYIAYILIAVNPYKRLPIYEEDVMWQYRKGTMGSLPPHVFAIAERAFRHMIGSKQSQSIICSGDSGAGKTETAKYVLRYLTTIAGSKSRNDSGSKQEPKAESSGAEVASNERRGGAMMGGQRQRGMLGGQRAQAPAQGEVTPEGSQSVLEKRILDANPILEAFGNAKTLRNNNSSRFGKYVRVHFGESNRVIGADITTYLLEKSRLSTQPSKERNFHIFYQLLGGASKEERDLWFLGEMSPNNFRYTNQSSCVKIDDVDDAVEYQHVRDAMNVSGLSIDEQKHLLSLLAALLHFGNVTFDEIERENTEASRLSEDGREGLKRFCDLTKCHINVVENALIQRTMVTRESTYVIPLKKSDAEFARDTLAKFIYGRLFDYVVKRINSGMPLQEASRHTIGILDISGFEYFDNNGFEQFLINYCNEKIQGYFIQQVFHQEQRIYVTEGLRWKSVTFEDNCKCLELIEMRSHGVLALLQEQSMAPKGSDERFTSNLTRVMFSNEKLMLVNKVPKKTKIPGLGKKRFKNEDAFIIRHFAADVCYQTRGWLMKNNDGIHTDLMNVLKDSGSTILSSLLKSENSEDAPFTPQGKGESKSTRFSTVSAKFHQDLSGLMESLDTTESHFIRCINPNLNRAPLKINRQSVMAQLRCSGMLEALRIMQAGFPTRCLFTDLYDRYRPYCPPEFTALGPKLFCEALLVALDLEGGTDFQMGLSRVFFRAGKAAMMDDVISGDPETLIRVAGKIRKWIARKRWRQAIWAVISILRLGRLIEDIREERRRREEEKRLASEEYQRELRRKREEEERVLQEELRRREEEERKRKEEEERRRREKEARREEKERQMRVLRAEADMKKDLQEQLDREREMYLLNEQEMMEEVDGLEKEIDAQQEHVDTLDKELAEAKSHERALNEMKVMSDDEIEKLRKEIEALQYKIRTTSHQITLANDNLSQLKELHRTTIVNWEVKYQETLEMKDEELSRIQEESDRKVAQLESEMQKLMAEMKRQAEIQIQKVVEEKEMEVTRVEVMAEEMLTVMEQSKAKVSKTGYMFKYEETLMSKKWKKYYFSIKSNFLAWYHDRNADKPLGIIDLEDAKVERSESKKKKHEGCEFKISVASGSGFRVLLLRVDYAKDRAPWMEAMAMAKSRHIAAGTINLDRYDVGAVKAGLVGGHTMTQSVISPRGDRN